MMAAGSESEKTVTKEPLSPAVRRRLQKCFEHGTKNSAGGNFDYATEMFTQCVAGDPGNLVYVQHFLANLQKKYNNNKKGSSFSGLRGAASKGLLKKAISKKDWDEATKNGLEALKLNPWDVPTLLAMASICEEQGHNECQLAYLKFALDTNSKDADINRACGFALGKQGQFDQAIACWHRVEQARPGDEEAQRQISNLSVDKTISRGFEAPEARPQEAESEQPHKQAAPVSRLTREQELEQAIAEDPSDVAAYTELADIYTRKDKLEDAERMLAKALDASGGDVRVRETLEDAQMNRAKQQVAIAEQRSQKEGEEGVKLYKRKKAELNALELDIFRARAERYPNNPNLKLELGLRLKKAGNFNEAIKAFQEARNDSKIKGRVLLELGECFQHIKQFKLAISNYAAAIEAISDREPEQRKLALYRAGVLAMGLKDFEQAERFLTELAGLDFGYKDVAERLDKISQARHKE